MADDIPEWADDWALKLAKLEGTGGGLSKSDGHYYGDVRAAFARYIAEHEQPPVDPLVLEARKLIDLAWPGEDALGGRLDDSMWMQRTLAALKRGIELGRQS